MGLRDQWAQQDHVVNEGGKAHQDHPDFAELTVLLDHQVNQDQSVKLVPQASQELPETRVTWALKDRKAAKARRDLAESLDDPDNLVNPDQTDLQERMALPVRKVLLDLPDLQVHPVSPDLAELPVLTEAQVMSDRRENRVCPANEATRENRVSRVKLELLDHEAYLELLDRKESVESAV